MAKRTKAVARQVAARVHEGEGLGSLPRRMPYSEEVRRLLPLCTDPEPVTTATALVTLIDELRKHFDIRCNDGRNHDDRVKARLLGRRQNGNDARNIKHVTGLPVVNWHSLPAGCPSLTGDAEEAIGELRRWADSQRAGKSRETEVLSDRENKVDSLIRQEGPLTGKEIHNRTGIGEKVLSNHIIPALKRKRGQKNKRSRGYFYPS
jgi:hypothetical protein